MKTSLLTLSVLLLALSPGPAAAQGAPPFRIPDGMDLGGCCQTVSPDLPDFPGFSTTGDLFLCFDRCNHNPFHGQHQVETDWAAPVPATAGPLPAPELCSFYSAEVTLTVVTDPTTTPPTTLSYSGELGMMYSRTWIEIDSSNPVSNETQVYRFLVNGDLCILDAEGDCDPTPVGSDCQVPPCAASFNGKVRFTGYLDYARDTRTGTFLQAWALNHDCDFIDHHEPAPKRGGSFHPDHSYTFVGPGAGFVVAVDSDAGNPPEDGPIVAEAVRPLDLGVAQTSGQICLAEQPATGSTLEYWWETCPCGGGFGEQYGLNDEPVAVYTHCSLGAVVTAGVEDYMTKGIGRWTAPFTYPGPERLRINFARYTNNEPCGMEGRPEFFYGVTTLGGWAAFSLTGTGSGQLDGLPTTFVDQSNSLSYSRNPVRNVRFWSDVILNLNLVPL